MAFWLGRKTAPTPADAVEVVAAETDASIPPCPPATNTSTIGLCPCPKPRPKVDAKLTIKRRPSSPKETGPHARPDPTEATAKYLREKANTLGTCAPNAGGEVRVHLEVTVAPSGKIERVRIVNLDGVPAAVSECVLEVMRALSPPGFDASAAETFALTVVL